MLRTKDKVTSGFTDRYLTLFGISLSSVILVSGLFDTFSNMFVGSWLMVLKGVLQMILGIGLLMALSVITAKHP